MLPVEDREGVRCEEEGRFGEVLLVSGLPGVARVEEREGETIRRD